MAFTKKEKNFILKNYSLMPISKIAEILGCNEKQISSFLITQDISQVRSFSEKNKTKIEKIKEVVIGTYEYKSLKQVILENQFFWISILVLIILLYYRSFGSIILSDEIAAWEILKTSFKWVDLVWGAAVGLNLSFLLFGPSALGSRIVTLVFHLLNILLFFTIFRNFINEKILKIAVILISIHSLIVEPITWVAANPYVAQGIIYFLIMYFSLLYERTGKFYYLLLYFYFVLSLVLTGNRTNFAPILAVCFNLFILKRSFKKELIVSFWLLLLIPVYTLTNREVVESRIASLTTGPFFEKFVQTLPFTTAKSLELVFFPYNLALFHEETLNPLYYTYAKLLTIFFFGLMIYLFFKKEKIYFGLASVACAYCLYIFSPIQVAWFVAERYMYLSVFMVCIFLALFINYLNKKISNLGNLLFVVYFFLFLTVSYFRFDDWEESYKLWDANTKVSPDSYRVRNNLAESYSQAKMYDKAQEQYLQAIRINPNFVEAYFNLSNAYLLQNKFSESETYLKKSIEMNPSLLEAYLRLAIIRGNQKDFSSARMFINKAKEINPTSELVLKFEQEFNKYEAQQKN